MNRRWPMGRYELLTWLVGGTAWMVAWMAFWTDQ